MLGSAHALNMVFECNFRAWFSTRWGRQTARLDAPDRIGEAREVAAICKQHHAHAGVFWLDGGYVQAHERVGVTSLHRHSHLPQRHIAQQPVGIAHVDKDVIAGTVFDHLCRWPTVLGHVGHDLAFEAAPRR